MNFTFADLNNSIMNMVQQGLSGKIPIDPQNAGSEKQLFAEKLSRILESGKKVDRGALPENLSETDSEGTEKFIEFLSQKLDRKKGVGFLTELKKMLMAVSGGEMKNLSIDKQGLATLKKLLSNAGFNPDELDDLITELTNKLEEKELGLDEVFDKLFELSVDIQDAPETESDNYFEISALPFLESILNSLQIPQDEVKEILANADADDRGISLENLIGELQQVQKKGFINHEMYQTKAGDENFKPLLKHLGINPQVFQDKPLTLNDLVAAFEEMRNNLSARKSGVDLMDQGTLKASTSESTKTSELINDLFKNLELKKMPDAKETFSFSKENITEQVNTDIVASFKEGTVRKTIFGKAQTVTASKEQQSLKEGIVTGLVDKPENLSIMKEGLENDKSFAKQLKSKNIAANEQNQVIASNTRTSESLPEPPVIKSRALVKNLPAFVTNQVSRSIVRAVNQGENTLRIQLKPPELGRLFMTIDNSGSSMKVNIVTENAAAREILISTGNELKATLSNSGVNLERFDVDMSSDFRQSMADARHQAGNFNKKGHSRTKQALNSGTGERSDDSISIDKILNEPGSLHFVA